MIGITSFGGYIPRLRIERMTIYGQMGWYAPATITVAQGERSFGNWDEDSLTMAVEAARDCLVGQERGRLQALHLATTTSPFADRSGAVLVKEALALEDEVACFDLGTSQRAGTQAILAALGQVSGGLAGSALVVAADQRPARPGSLYEMWFGDGAAALCLGREGVIAEYLASRGVRPDVAHELIGTVYTLVREKPATPLRDGREFASLLNACGHLEVYVHVYDGRVFHVKPETRIPKHFDRFKGLMAQLLIRERVPPTGERSSWRR